MHYLDLGLFYYQIDYIRKIIKAQHKDSLLEEMNYCLVVIPHYPSLKIFSNNLKSIARLTASEYHDLMKVMIFIVDNLYEKNTKNIENLLKIMIWQNYIKNVYVANNLPSRDVAYCG